MNFQRKKVATALAYTLGMSGAVTLSAANAQTTASPGEIRVDVTGSNIKRVEGEGALPVQTITRQDIQQTGVLSTMELVDKLAINQSFGSFNAALGEGSGLVGFSGASLRGLGPQRTLILVNGKRIAPYALSTGNNYSGVDLSQIPLSVVERVEILKDGASAIYGSDAVAGVINVILRNDFKGVEAGGQYLSSEAGGGDAYQAHIVVGAGDLAADKWNAWFAFDYQNQMSLRALDREISKTSFLPDLGRNRTSGNSIPANITIPGVRGTKNPGYPACLPPFSIPTTPFSPNQCRFDYAATIDTIPPSTKENYMGRVTWQFAPNHQAYFEGGYFRGDYLQRISPTPVSGAFTNNPVNLQPGTQFYPTQFVISQGGDPTKPLPLSYRGLEFGARSDEVHVDQYRAVAGLTGNFGKWDYAADLNYTSNKEVDSYVGGYLSETHFVPFLTQGTLNPFGFNTPQAIQTAIAGNSLVLGDASTNKASNYGGSFKMSSDIWALPAGPLGFAVGVDGRHEKLELINSDFLSSGDIIGGLGAIPSLESATRNVWAAYTEFSIPIVKTLEGNVAVRYDHYSDFGSTTNPKIALRWQPTREILVRGSWGTGFRAPTLFDLDQPNYRTNTNNNFDDPERCPITQSVFDCQLQFNSVRGGNKALKPERSQQYSIGGVWEPGWQYTQGLSIGVDYFWVKIKDVITQVSADTIFGDYANYATQIVPGFGLPYVVRKPGVDPNYPNLPNVIDYVIEPTVNAGRQTVDGIDVDLRYRLPTVLWPTTWGRLEARLNGTYTSNWKQTDLISGNDINYAGTSGNPQGAISRWRHYATLDWTYGPWGVTLADTYQHGYTETYFSDLTGDQITRRVGDYDVWDIQGRFSGFKNVQLALGMRNMFDRAPPVVGGVGTFQFGYDASYGDPRGRMYYGTVSVAFK